MIVLVEIKKFGGLNDDPPELTCRPRPFDRTVRTRRYLLCFVFLFLFCFCQRTFLLPTNRAETKYL